jgi:glycosyltransferase involved in cell wall biosynthesis
MALDFRLKSAKISFIIPAYNRVGLIGDTLRGLLNQTVQAKEIIVVDDGSQDGTAEAAEQEFSVFSKQFSAKSSIQNSAPTKCWPWGGEESEVDSSC